MLPGFGSGWMETGSGKTKPPMAGVADFTPNSRNLHPAFTRVPEGIGVSSRNFRRPVPLRFMTTALTTTLLILFAILPPVLLAVRAFLPSRMPWWGLLTILLLLGEGFILAAAMLNETPETGAAKVFALFFGWLYALLWFLPWLLVYGVIQGVRRWRSDKAAGIPGAGRALLRSQLPVILILVGIGLFLGGFVYDVFFAGIPYPDPTPEMQARHELHSGIASAIRWTGAAVFLSGPMTGFARWLQGRVSNAA